MGQRVNMKGNIDENRYEAGYLDEYKTWFHNNLRGIVNPIPRVGREIEDVQMRSRSTHIIFKRNETKGNRNFDEGSTNTNLENLKAEGLSCDFTRFNRCEGLFDVSRCNPG